MSFRYSLCALCVQRQGQGVQFSVTNGRGCFICGGLTSRVDSIKRKALRVIDRQQFETFSTGTIIPAEIQEREDMLRSELKIRGGETMKSQLSRMIAQAVRSETGRTIDRFRPDVTILVDLGTSSVQTQARPIFVHGKYT